MAIVLAAQSHAPDRGAIARFFGLSPLVPDARSAYRDALGELAVGEVLDGLGQRWDVLHDLPLHEGTLEHLVIGPAGTFAVRAARYAGADVVVDGTRLLVDSEPQEDLFLALEHADAATATLTRAAGGPVPVRALLVIVDARRITVRRATGGVLVVASGQLARALTRAPALASGDEVARISDLADLESTWPEASEAQLDTQRLHRDFAAVSSHERAAVVTRVLWLVVGFTIAYGTIWALTAFFVGQLLVG
jgi:hypothetical protein